MSHVGSLSGSAEILIDGRGLGTVEYEIEVYRDDLTGRLDSAGRIEGDDGLLIAAMQVRPDQLVELVSDAGTITIHVTAYVAESGEAKIIVSGSVPGL